MSTAICALLKLSNEVLLAVLVEVNFPTIYPLLDSPDVLGLLSKICLTTWAIESINGHIPSVYCDGFWTQLHETRSIMVGEVVLAALRAVERRPQWCLSILASARTMSSWKGWLEQRGWKWSPVDGRDVPMELKFSCDDSQLQLQQFIAVLGVETLHPGSVTCLAFAELFYLISSSDETLYTIPYQLVLGSSSTMEMGFISSDIMVHFYPELLAHGQFTDNKAIYPIDFPEWLTQRRQMQYVSTTNWSTLCGTCCPGVWRWTEDGGSLIMNHGAYRKCIV
uniref:Uncharacterized protein n=1 Tax=Moniliophthora roreri TaxID=221103 RepID=A0A0W0EZM0_MONRR